MPQHTAVGSDAATLTTLVDQAEKAGEKVVQALAAGNSWVVITEAKPKVGRPPKTPQTRS